MFVVLRVAWVVELVADEGETYRIVHLPISMVWFLKYVRCVMYVGIAIMKFMRDQYYSYSLTVQSSNSPLIERTVHFLSN